MMDTEAYTVIPRIYLDDAKDRSREFDDYIRKIIEHKN